MISLSKDEIERYSRQIMYAGQKGQLALKSARVVVIGAGGIGSALLPYLAASGVGYIRLLEPDVVEKSNLARQILYREQDIGALKGAVCVNVLRELNPHIELDWRPVRFQKGSEGADLKGIDLLFEGSDDIESKFLASDLSLEKKVGAIIGGIGTTQGHIFPVSGESSRGCYRCVFEDIPSGELPTCATEGVLSPLPGVAGAMMAYRGVRYLLEKKMPDEIDMLQEGRWRSLKLKKSSACRHVGE